MSNSLEGGTRGNSLEGGTRGLALLIIRANNIPKLLKDYLTLQFARILSDNYSESTSENKKCNKIFIILCAKRIKEMFCIIKENYYKGGITN